MQEFWTGLGILCAYFIICASIAMLFRKTIKIPNEIFRKTLHFILLTSLFVFVYAYQTWWISALTCLCIIAVAYPILFFFERFKTYSDTVTERKKGELRSSLIIVFVMFATVIAVCWGWLGDKVLTLAVIYSWGYGDALAALIGTRYGKHKIYKKKSLEGTLSMLVTSFVTVSAILLIHNIIPWYGSLITALAVSVVASAVELYTPDGLDTITCPFASMAVMLPMIMLFGGIV